jgi:tRNA (guanine9-N1)-methyltransferase
LDLGFDDKMSDKVRGCLFVLFHGMSQRYCISCSIQEITSLCSQLAYVYSVNRRSSNPFRSLLFTSLNGRTLSRLEKLNDAGYKRWAGTEWWAEGYERLWAQNSAGSPPGDGESSRGAATEDDRAQDNEDDNDPEKLLATPVSRDRVVYLTADSTEVLEELKEGETYVIGGLCDHNRYKVRGDIDGANSLHKGFRRISV